MASANTKPCPKCGSSVPLHARFCGQCGHTFTPTTLDEATADPPAAPAPPAAPSSQRGAVGMGTLFGHAALTPNAAAAAAAPPAGAPPPPAETTPRALGKTMMLGGTGEPPISSSMPTPRVPASLEAPPTVPTAPPIMSDKQTMLGIPAIALPPPKAEPPKPVTPSPQAFAPATKTMLGVAIPGIAPTHEASPPKPAASARAGTLLGVAAPGIAPLHAGVAQRGGTGEGKSARKAPEIPAIVPAPPPLVMQPLPEAPTRPQRKGIPAVAVVGIVFAVVAVGVGALLLLKPAAPLSAQPQLDETGKESLKIRCPSCPDGTVIALGASTAKVEAASATLALPAPLSIGDNDLEMKIDRPLAGRDETVKVHVPVAYRVKTDLSTLTASPPVVTVQVDAAPDTEVVVDGKPVTLAGGKGSLPIDLASELEGPSDDLKTIDRKIPFSVKPKGAKAAESGQLTLRVGIAPLHLDAPGLELYTERATGNIAGQVKPSSTLTVDGQNVAVDPQGRFGVRVELPASGEKTLTLVASAPPSAPRTVHAKIVRVPSLAAAAKTLDAKSPMGFDAYGSDPKAKLGSLVVVDGDIQDVRVSQGQTVMAVEEKATCQASSARACVVRIMHGEEVKAARGDKIHAYGRITGTATLNGATIPSIEGMLVIPKPAAHK